MDGGWVSTRSLKRKGIGTVAMSLGPSGRPPSTNSSVGLSATEPSAVGVSCPGLSMLRLTDFSFAPCATRMAVPSSEAPIPTGSVGRMIARELSKGSTPMRCLLVQRSPALLPPDPVQSSVRTKGVGASLSSATSRKVIDGSPRTGRNKRAAGVPLRCTKTAADAKAPIVTEGIATASPIFFGSGSRCASSSGIARHGPGLRMVLVLVLMSTPFSAQKGKSCRPQVVLQASLTVVVLPGPISRSFVRRGMSLARSLIRSSARTVPPSYCRSKSELATYSVDPPGERTRAVG